MEKKEKLVDLKTKAEKISDEHLKELQKVVNIINTIQSKVGQIEGQKHSLLHELHASQTKIMEMQDTFTKEYGSCDINIADGKINWEKDEK